MGAHMVAVVMTGGAALGVVGWVLAKLGKALITIAEALAAGWVPDETIKQLETFVTGPVTRDTAVLPFPTKPTDPTGSTRGGAA